MAHQTKGPAIVVQPDEGKSYWQPVPANGYSEVKLSRRNLPADDKFSMGVQVIAPHSYIREHQHDAFNEVLFFFEGEGRVEVDGVSHPVRPGTTVYAGHWVKHKIINESDKDLKMAWTLMPGGLENFFAGIGRARTPGEPAPSPFPRPDNVEEIEAATVFAPIQDSPPAD